MGSIGRWEGRKEGSKDGWMDGRSGRDTSVGRSEQSFTFFNFRQHCDLSTTGQDRIKAISCEKEGGKEGRIGRKEVGLLR